MPSALVIALDSGSVQAAVLSRRFGKVRVQGMATESLAPGALLPGPTEDNIRDRAEVSAALRRAVAALPGERPPVCLVLPLGVARTQLLEVPPGGEPAEYARFRLAGDLPFAASEAVVDVAPLPGGRVLAAAVRRRVVEHYEQALEAAGLRLARVDLAGISGLAHLATRRPARDLVDVLLGDASVGFAAWVEGQVVAWRSRLRDAGDVTRVLDEAQRTGAVARCRTPALRIVGPGAAAAAGAWRARGGEIEAGWAAEGLDGAEAAWLGAALT